MYSLANMNKEAREMGNSDNRSEAADLIMHSLVEFICRSQNVTHHVASKGQLATFVLVKPGLKT